MRGFLHRWCDRRLIRDANRMLLKARGERDAMQKRLEELAERHAHETQLRDDEIERLNAHVDALVSHNAELAASRSLLADVEEGRQVSRKEAVERLSID